MTQLPELNPEFDTRHPSGAILVRSRRGGMLHSIVLSEEAMETDANSLAEGILRTASASFLKASMQIRADIIASNPDYGPTSSVPTPQDLDDAMVALQAHTLPPTPH